MFQILVVEDDNELRDLFCAVLTENGYTAVPAVDGIDAFDILADLENGFRALDNLTL